MLQELPRAGRRQKDSGSGSNNTSQLPYFLYRGQRRKGNRLQTLGRKLSPEPVLFRGHWGSHSYNQLQRWVGWEMGFTSSASWHDSVPCSELAHGLPEVIQGKRGARELNNYSEPYETATVQPL